MASDHVGGINLKWGIKEDPWSDEDASSEI